MSAARSLVLGSIASFKQGWLFRRTLAAHTGVSIRTVQRAITQAKAEGLLGTARAKPHEIHPPGSKVPVRCGWSHRWIVGWGLALHACKQAVERARLRRLTKLVAPTQPKQKPVKRWTAEEIDAELERRAVHSTPRVE